MTERYINIINISLILASMYCTYNYTRINKSNKQKHIGYILFINLIYTSMCIFIGNMKIGYIMSSLSTITLVNWISNYKNFKKNKNYYIQIFYILNICILINILINESINIYIMIIPVILVVLNLMLSYKYSINKKNQINMIIVNLILSLDIILNLNLVNNVIQILIICINVNILFNILNKNIYRISIKEKEIEQSLKEVDLKLSKRLNKLKNNKDITKEINQKIKNKSELLDLILNQSNKCFLIIDKDGYIHNEDDNFTNIWNEYKDYKYKIKLTYFLEKSVENNIEVLLDIQKVYNLGIEVKGEIINKDGRYFECSYAPFKINKHNIGVVCSITDITYKKQSQLQIDENQIKYKKIIETIPYSILLTDKNKITYTNNKNLDIDINNENIKELILDDIMEGESSYFKEDGTKKNIVINKTSFLEENTIKNIVVLRDITEYRELIKKIQRSKNKYESLVNSIPEGIYMCDIKNGDCVYANNKLLEIIGGRTIKDINNNEIKDKIILGLSNCGDVVKFIRHKIYNNYGDECYIELASITMEINNNYKGIAIVRDVTEQVKVENIEKEIRRKKLEYKQKNDFFVNMSHELKTPLNLITSTNQLVKSVYKNEIKKNPKGELSRVTSIVQKQGYLSLGLIENIMTLTKLESDFYESSLDCYDIVSIVEDIVIELNKYVEENGIEMIFDTYIEEKVINVDPDDIEKILLAIFSKVIKQSNRNSTIYTYISDKDENINIVIENKGAYNNKINLTKQSKESLNMNLEVAKSIVKLYKGSIYILETKNNIKIEINMKVSSNVGYHNMKNRVLNSEAIYSEYSKINVL